MASTYPGTLDTFTNPAGTQTLDSPDHAQQHGDVNDAVEAIESVLGTTSGTAVLMNFAAGDFAARINSGGTLQQALVGGTISSSVINSTTVGTPAVTGGTITSAVINVGSDAQGDIYYRNGSGAFSRLAAGTSGQVLQTQGAGANPQWANSASQTSFLSVVGTTNGTTSTSATYIDVPELSATIVTSDGTAFAILDSMHANTSAGGPANYFALKLDSDSEVAERYINIYTASGVHQTMTQYLFTGLSAGTHTITGRYKTGGGTISLTGVNRRLTVMYS